MSTDIATRALLLTVARAAIEAAVCGTQTPPVPAAPIFLEYRGVFATLKRKRQLRGCIGRIEADMPLSSLLPLMAVMAATRDPRFPAVSAHELDTLHIEISLLTTPSIISRPADIEIGRHGIIASAHGRRGVLLPQVATEYGWNADEFLAQACVKASLPSDAWKKPDTSLHIFESEIIAE